MSEQKPKQYFVMVDALSMVFLSKLIPTLRFVEVESVPSDDKSFHYLVNPIDEEVPTPEEITVIE